MTDDYLNQARIEYEQDIERLKREFALQSVATATSTVSPYVPGASILANSGQFFTQAVQQANQAPLSYMVPETYGILCDRNGKELPPEWRGAEMTSITKEAIRYGTLWKVTFNSKWSSDGVFAYFSTEDYSGAEVLKMANTFMEALNQRRLG